MPNLDLVGIEFEYTDVRIQSHPRLLNFVRQANLAITHDASTESPSYVLAEGSLPVKNRTVDPGLNKLLFRKDTIGGELVSRIIDTSDDSWIKVFDRLILNLKMYGERENSNRGSIHVHVNFPEDEVNSRYHTLTLLKKSFLLSGYMENFFFRIGGMGRSHRGSNMDYIYYRPITGNGPQIVTGALSGKLTPILNFDEVIKSAGPTEFLVRCGDIIGARGRYHPSRYMWVNYYNLRHAERSNIEFRVFNKTLNVASLYAIVKLCTKFTKACYNLDLKDIEEISDRNPVSLAQKIVDPERYVSNIFDLLDIDRSSFLGKQLMYLWGTSPIPEYNDYRVFSHLEGRTDRVFYDENNKKFFPKPLKEKEALKIRKPLYVDIHYLNGKNEHIYPESIDVSA